MSKIVEWFLVPLFFFMSIFYAFNSLCTDLKKVYHHVNNGQESIEQGNVSFYFSSQPNMKKIEDGNGQSGYSFFFPCHVNGSECEKMISRLNGYSGSLYSVNIQKVTEPSAGIQITFICNPDKIALSYDSFDSIGMQKGIVFHLYNKDVLQMLDQSKNKPILRMLSRSTTPSLMIDPGHGCHDSGAVGCFGVTEKTVCLAVSKHVAQQLNDKGYEVFLTRNDDSYLFLDERTALAHAQQVDYFVSIHANSAHNAHSHGVETFCLQQSLFNPVFSTLSCPEKELVAHYVQTKNAMSHKIALSIQKHVCSDVVNTDIIFKKPHDRTVKHAASQVLLGMQVPAVLIEIGFVSHPQEALLLKSEKYQQFLAQRIVDGIIAALST